jgi:hypothetical protein
MSKSDPTPEEIMEKCRKIRKSRGVVPHRVDARNGYMADHPVHPKNWKGHRVAPDYDFDCPLGMR